MIKKYNEFNNKTYIPISNLTTEKDIVLVDTRYPNDIISTHNSGKMPLDKLRVMSMVKKLENGGELPPIKIDKNNNIIDGHHRYMAYKLSNIDTVPFEYDKRIYEGIKHLLVGPSEEEIFNYYELGTITVPNELLMSSAEKGVLYGVKLAIERGADIHFNNDAAFGFACDSNNFKLVKFLLENGADVKVEGGVLLQNACYFGQKDIAKILIENGVDLHCDDDRPLRFAVENKHYDVIKVLLENGANVHAWNNYLFNKYDGYIDYKDIMKLLRKYE